MKTLSLVFALCAYSAMASLQDAHHDIVVPEAPTELPTAQQDFLVESYAKAKQTVKQLGNSSACKDLADATEVSVQDSVKAQQALIDAMNNGTECRVAGDLLISHAKTAFDEAQTASDNATIALNIAQNKTIDLGSMEWSDMEGKKCSSTFFEQGAWAEQKKVVDEATRKITQASGALDALKKANDSAEGHADDLVEKCHCKAIDDYEAAIVKANADFKVANEKAMTQAAHIRCLADGTELDKCKVSDIPQVVAKALPAGTQCGPALNLNDKDDVFCDDTCKKEVVKLLSINKSPKGCNNPLFKKTDMSFYAEKGFERCATEDTNDSSMYRNCAGPGALLIIAKGKTTGELFGVFAPLNCPSDQNGAANPKKYLDLSDPNTVKLFNLNKKWVFPPKESEKQFQQYCDTVVPYCFGKDCQLSTTDCGQHCPRIASKADFWIANFGGTDSAFAGETFDNCMAVGQKPSQKPSTFLSGFESGTEERILFYAYKSVQ